MDAREYLGQIRKLRERISSRRKRIEEARYMVIAGGGGLTGDAERVQTSPSINGQYNAVDSYLDLERELNIDVHNFMMKLKEIERTIDQIDNDNYCMVVSERWIADKSLEQIAVDTGYSFDRIRYFYWKGMKAMQKITKDIENNT